MKESISYSFILNIVILFIFICFAVIMGIFSYNRAFRAGIIIVDTIEKYEGYNCLSAAEIDKKLATISYNLPFDANCDKAYNTTLCMTDIKKNYAVVSYNLDFNEGNYIPINEKLSNVKDTRYENMNTKYECSLTEGCKNTKKYQYGVFTYMYVDLPVVSNLLKLSVYSKTNVINEFRDIYIQESRPYDIRLIPDNIEVIKYLKAEMFAFNVQHEVGNRAKGNLASSLDIVNPEYNARLAYQYDTKGNFPKITSEDGSEVLNGYSSRYCGYTHDFSKY